jgi:dTDP-4-amino-4,6-dideoxygalactose transaminase
MIPFSPPKIDQKIIDAVTNVLRSGWITTGPVTDQFERKLEKYTGNPKTLCVNSATAGLELMLRWFGVQPGDEVILPAYTYAATGNVVLHLGAKPVFVDVNEDFNISATEIEKALSSRTKVIIPVDIGGFPVDYDQIFKVVYSTDSTKKFTPNNSVQETLNRPLILADSAHSLGGIYKNKKIGCIADAAVYSFHAVKNLTTGEGGAIALNLPKPFDNSSIYNFLRIFALHGQSKDAFSKELKNGWEYDIYYPGYKANMPDILAAMGLVEIERYASETLPKRKKIFNFYNQRLTNLAWANIPKHSTADRISSYHLYMLRLNGHKKEHRDHIIQRMYESGVAVNIHFKPLPMMSYYRNLGYNISNYPISYKLYENEITLPVYYSLTEKNLEIIVKTLIKVIQSFTKKTLISI